MQTNKFMILWDSFAEKISSQCARVEIFIRYRRKSDRKD